MITLKHIDKVTKLPLKAYFSNSKIKFSSKALISRNKNFEQSYCNTQSKINRLCVLRKSTKSSVDKNEENNDHVKIIDEIVNFGDRRDELCCKSKDEGISVAIVGGGCATVCMTMLLKQNPAIKEIRLIDTDNSLIGPVCDMRHIDTSTTIRHFKKNSIHDGLRNTNIVAVMDETNFMMGNKGPFLQFVNSSNYVKNVAECMINACPKALVAVFAHPVTATLPLISEIYKYSGNWDPNRIFGSAALESMRISAMTASLLDLNPSFISVPIVGGIDSLTVLPLLSRARPFNSFTEENECLLIHQLRSADMKLFKTETKGSTLSSGMAAAKFISTVINGIKKQNISITSAYVRSDVLPGCQYMTSEVQFGLNGVQQNFGLPKVSSTEISMIEQAAPVINKIVKTAINFLHTGKIK